MLAGAAGVLTGSAGCLNRFQASVDRDTPDQISLSIASVPADEDSVPVRIARHLADNLGTAGIDVSLQPVTTERLWRNVLLNGEFDLYVGQHPGYGDPDVLYELLHSRFSEEPGWQNPFGYVNVPGVDDLLDSQRDATDGTRTRILDSLVETFRTEAPFSVVAYPEEPRAIRPDRYDRWEHRSLESPLGYLGLRAKNPDAIGDRDAETLHVGTSNGRITRNLNPLAVEFRDRWVVVGLLYDSLGRRIETDVEPWLAREWSWDDDRLRVTLREDLAWHDGEPLRAADVAFTYRLLWDTTATEEEPSVPAPCFRSQSTLVERVEATDDRTIEFEIDAAPEVGLHALTVPVLPRHVWEERTDLTSIAGFDFDGVTEAVVHDNMQPVGSGPLRFDSVEPNTRLEFVRNDDHFLVDLPEDDPLSAFAGGPPYERLVFACSPSQANVVEAIQAGQLDASAGGLTPTEIERARSASEIELGFEDVSAFYHVGFDVRNAPLSNPRFRQAISRLLDREYLRTDAFEGYATPAFSPITAGSSGEWQAGHEAGFAGVSGTGAVEEERARELFREAGYIYNESGELVVR